jgi:hypothetical protein
MVGGRYHCADSRRRAREPGARSHLWRAKWQTDSPTVAGRKCSKPVNQTYPYYHQHSAHSPWQRPSNFSRIAQATVRIPTRYPPADTRKLR